MKSQQILIVFSALVCGAYSQQVVPVSCNYTVQQNFNLTAYLGKWYEVEKSNFIEEVGGICIEANYQQFFNGSIEVDNRQIMEATGEWFTMVGNARPLNESSTEAKYLVSFPSVGAYDGPYWVLDSDYTNYTLILSCSNYGNGNSFQTMWFLSRERSPSAEIRDYVHNKIAELGLSTYLVLKPTVQENCVSNITSY